MTRVRDIARVELGADVYTTNAYLDGKVATALLIYQRPGSNALATAAATESPSRTSPTIGSAWPPASSISLAAV